MNRRISAARSPSPLRSLAALLVVAMSLTGCAAMTQDVAQYYRQMAANFKEAEDKAGVDLSTSERKANMLLKGGEVRQFNKAQREVSRLKDWQEHCARQRVRFEKAAEKLEPSSSSPGDPGLQTVPSS